MQFIPFILISWHSIMDDNLKKLRSIVNLLNTSNDINSNEINDFIVRYQELKKEYIVLNHNILFYTSYSFVFYFRLEFRRFFGLFSVM